MLHLRSQLIDPDQISRALQLVQSTSPSYLLLASLDAARHQVAQHGTPLLSQTLELAKIARDRLRQIPGLRVFAPHPSPGCLTLDPTRLTVDVSGLNLTGFRADELLHTQLGVTAELPGLHHLTFIISIGNTREDIAQLVKGFEILVSESNTFDLTLPGLNTNELPEHPLFQKRLRKTSDESLEGRPNRAEAPIFSLPIHSVSSQPLTPRDAFFAPTETLAIEHTSDRIAAELVCPYPPGIPILIPGDRISTAALTFLQQVLAAGGVITGCADTDLKTLKVVKQQEQ
jgi:arginine/lysine/ornithine decarboxylase